MADPNEILSNLHSAFESFKAENDTRINDLKRGQEDVVRNEKVERINAAIGDMQASMDKVNERLANLSVSGASDNRQIVDPEYSKAFASFIRKGDVNAAALNKGAEAEGGYLTPTEWDRTITDLLVQASPFRSLASVQSVSVAHFSKLFNNRGTASGWVGETAARPETANSTFSSLKYDIGEIYANPAATQQILDDALINIEQFIASEVQTEFAKRESEAFISGDGVNKPTGILSYVAGGTNATKHPFGSITTIASGDAAKVLPDSILNLVYGLHSQFTGNARFIMNRTTQGAVRVMKDKNDQYLWQPSYAAGQPSTLAGYPLVEVPDMPNVGAGSLPIMFGDFKQGYLVVDRMGVRVLRDPYSNKPYVTFYTTKRVGGGLLNPEPLIALKVATSMAVQTAAKPTP